MNRAERRRRARPHDKEPVLIAGDGIVAANLGQRYEARPHAELPPKQPGHHRWIAAGAWVLSPAMVEKAHDPDTSKFLEQTLDAIRPGSPCPAPAADV